MNWNIMPEAGLKEKKKGKESNAFEPKHRQ